MGSPLILKSIGELLGKSFFIPSYQRGYRWSKRQVEDLLNDIWEFIQKNPKSEEFYCLQPVVVYNNNKSEQWSVIDGQQRLTTIFLILKSLEDKIDSDKKNYFLKYETRTGSEKYLETLNEQGKNENIDYCHLYNAYEIINNWFKQKANNGSPSIKSKFISPLLEEVKVIWYEIDSSQDNKIDIFTRINMGKIPLTNAELIKALLLKINEKSQFELASEWDNIEYALQNDDFWYFLGSKDDKATRIELIFELIASLYKTEYEIEINNSSLDNYYTFHIFNIVFAGKKKSNKEIWADVKTHFRILNEWFENRELFHKIGFLLAEGNVTIARLISKSINSSKDEFRTTLDREIKVLFKDIDIESLEYGDNKIKKILLLFNIQTLLNNKDSNAKFQFDRYKKNSWDIEHIRSQTDAEPRKLDEKNSFIEEYGTELQKSKKDEIVKNESAFKKFYQDKRLEIEGEDFNKASISNLALLDSGTNRSYKNEFFKVKRKTILENDMNGTFVPICTRNVFMKYYTKEPGNLYQWTAQDAGDYLINIRETLKDYFNEGQNDGN